MLGLLKMLARLKQPKRPRPYRITIVESRVAPFAMGAEVAKIMAWGYFDARNQPLDEKQAQIQREGKEGLVVSQNTGYAPRPSHDGLTVCVDEVCDLGNNPDPHACLRALMLSLTQKRAHKS